MSVRLKHWLRLMFCATLSGVVGAAGLIAPSGTVLAQTPLVGFAVSNTDSARKLYRIDFATGEATAIGPTGTSKVEGLALSSSGDLFAVNPATSQLLKCSTETGACTVVGTLTGVAPSLTGNAGLAFAADGMLYVGLNAALFRVDPATGAATFVGNTGGAIGGLAGIAPQANCPSGLYALGSNTDRGKLFCVSTVNGTLTSLTTFAGFSPVDGGLDGLPDGSVLYGVADMGSAGSQIFRVAADKLIPEQVIRITVGGSELTGLESLAIRRGGSTGPASSDPHAVPIGGALPISALAVALAALVGMVGRTRRHPGR
ncbi:MAG: hypothetical protein ACK4XK_01150 [Casimicrobiaceae bacterium]